MKFKQLKTYLTKNLMIDKNGNAIIKLIKGTTHVVLKKGVSEMNKGPKQPTIRELIVDMSKDIKSLKDDVKSLKDDMKIVKKDIKQMKETPTMKRELK